VQTDFDADAALSQQTSFVLLDLCVQISCLCVGADPATLRATCEAQIKLQTDGPLCPEKTNFVFN
jgi:hypothetical protein